MTAITCKGNACKDITFVQSIGKVSAKQEWKMLSIDYCKDTVEKYNTGNRNKHIFKIRLICML